VTKAIVLFK